MTPTRIFQAMLLAFIAVILASTGYAFAATNTVTPDTGGDGATTVSGYTVTNVSYNLNASDPSRVDSTSFTLSANARTVSIKLSDAGSTWYSCTALNANDWSCNTPGATTASIDQLRVIATNK